MLCGQVRGGLLDSLKELPGTAGEGFTVLSVSIDPEDRPLQSRRQKEATLSRYDRSMTPTGWRFLTGTAPNIERLCQVVGFHSIYQAGEDDTRAQYAHPAGLVILTPSGEVSAYVFGIQFNPHEIERALQQAGHEEVSQPSDVLLLLCYHYDPKSGRYSLSIWRLLQVSCTLTVLALLLLISRQRGRHEVR
jgi:protein SCO1/2